MTSVWRCPHGAALDGGTFPQNTAGKAEQMTETNTTEATETEAPMSSPELIRFYARAARDCAILAGDKDTTAPDASALYAMADRCLANVHALAMDMSYDVPGGLRERMTIALVGHERRTPWVDTLTERSCTQLRWGTTCNDARLRVALDTDWSLHS